LIGERSNLPAPSTEMPYGISFPAPAEEESSGGGISVTQIWCMVRAHLWLSIAIFVPLAVLGFIVIKALPKTFQSQATLIVNADNIDPLAGRTGPSQAMSTFFQTQSALIFDKVMLQPVVDRLQLQKDVRFTRGKAPDPNASPIEINDALLTALRRSLNVQSGAGQLLYIAAQANDPTLAADIANTVAEEYIRQTSERTSAPAAERAARYAAQLGELKDKVDKVQAKVAEFRQRTEMTALGAGGDSEGALLADLEGQLRTAQNARRQLEARLGNSGAESSSALNADEVAVLRTKLTALETQMVEARATMGARHPKIVQLQVEIDATRRALQSGADTALGRARELENKYRAAADQERQQLLRRRVMQDEGARLMLEQQQAEQAYAKALSGQSEVQFASQGNYKDVTLVSRAEPPLRASGSGKLKLFAMLLAASFGLSFGAPFAYELFINRRIRCRDDLEKGLRVIALAQFGPVTPVPHG